MARNQASAVRHALRGNRGRKKSTGPGPLGTGSTLLNLACTDMVDGGFLPGHYYLFVGDSDSGKTFIGMTCFAEAAINKAYDKYRLIYDGTEHGALMNVRKFFGKAVEERLESPKVDGSGEPVYSQTVEQFYDHVDDALRDGRPFVYVLDSQDALSSEAEQKKFDQRKRSRRKTTTDDDATKSLGSYGDGKAKVHSSSLRKIIGPLYDSKSILIILNQTRDSFSIFESGTFSGGRALKFYAKLQLWSSVRGRIKRQVRGKNRQLGITSKVKIVKNHITGKDKIVEIPIYHSHGIDDIGGCVDYLVSEGIWSKNKSGTIEVHGIGQKFSGRMDDVVRRIEEDGMLEDLRDLVGMTWHDIEKACEVKRQRRYE